MVINAIGINILKNILKEREKEDNGNLPIYRNDLNTSVAFQVLTNQIVVVEMKNHKLYRIKIEQIMVVKHNNNKLKFIFI